MDTTLGLFLVISAAVLGGAVAKLLKFPLLVGYILGGLLFGVIFPNVFRGVSNLAQIGTILLLFTIGIELSFERLSKFFKLAVFGAPIQIIIVTGILYFVLTALGINGVTSLVLAAGFSLSSTAVVLKILTEKGEIDTIHGGAMFSWLLVQDLAVIPMMVVLPLLARGSSIGAIGGPIAFSLGKAILVLVTAVILGKLVVPRVIHKIASTNSRELLVLIAVAIALGTAVLTSLFGISPALGAFLAGVVISESQENHAVLSEIRPLRDLFVALFFVSLGFLVDPVILVHNIGLILVITLAVMMVKTLVILLVSVVFGYRGKTAIANSLGLSQVGEFAFVIFSAALVGGIIDKTDASIGISVTLFSLIAAPFLFRSIVPVWRKLKGMKMFSPGESSHLTADGVVFTNHIILCGYGRVGSWIGRALEENKIPFVVVEYNQAIVGELKEKNTPVVYGDPGEPEILEALNIKEAKAIILAIPDHVAQENLVAYVQTVAPNVKIISRAHLEEDVQSLKDLKVARIVQPEFEAAIAIIKSILVGMGKPKEEISAVLKGLRMAHSK